MSNISLYDKFVALSNSMRDLRIQKSKTDSIKESKKIENALLSSKKEMDATLAELVKNFTDFTFENKSKYSYPRQYDLCELKGNRFIWFHSAETKIKSCGSLVAKMQRDCGEGQREYTFLVIPKDFIFSPSLYIRRIEKQTLENNIMSYEKKIETLLQTISEHQSVLKKYEVALDKLRSSV